MLGLLNFFVEYLIGNQSRNVHVATLDLDSAMLQKVRDALKIPALFRSSGY